MTDKDDKLIFEAYLQEKFERDAAIDTIANLVSTPRNDKVIISNIQMILAGMTAEEKYDVLINLHGKVNDDMYTRMIEGDLYRLFVPDSVQSAAPKQPESVPSDDIPQDMGEISNVNEPVETHDNNLNQIQNYFLQKLQQVIEDSYPEAFKSVDQAVEERKAVRQSLNDDPAFQALNKKVVESGKAVKEYEQMALDQFHAE